MINTPAKKTDPLLLMVFLLIAAVIAFLGWLICHTPPAPMLLAGLINNHQHLSGVASPVTAVLLNFRGYDTLLEVMVLLVAVIGVWSLTRASLPPGYRPLSPVQISVVRLLTPLMCLVAFYLVWRGSHLAGGAFQGGAVLGGAGVMLLITEIPWTRTPSAILLRAGLLIGPVLFLIIAVSCIYTGGALLAYPQEKVGSILLLLETFCAVSIGITIASLFAGGRPKDK